MKLLYCPICNECLQYRDIKCFIDYYNVGIISNNTLINQLEFHIYYCITSSCRFRLKYYNNEAYNLKSVIYFEKGNNYKDITIL